MCEDICILTDHIAFCQSICRAYQVDTIDVTGASLTFNFAHGARAPETGCFPSEISPKLGSQQWRPELGIKPL